MMGRLVVHVSNYTGASLLVTLAGFISFPIFTRLFSVDEYGIMSLISSSLMLLVGVAKLGIQQSIVRFYAEVSTQKRDATVVQFFSTVLFGMGAAGLIVTLLWLAISQVIPSSWWNDPRVSWLLLLTSVLVMIRVFDSAVVNVMRAQQRSGLVSLYAVLKKYVGLGIVLVTVFYFLPGLPGFYAGLIFSEALAVLVLGVIVFRGMPIGPRQFSVPLFRSMLAFGVPMIAYEVGGGLLSFGDRYVIQALLGAQSLGVYSAAYNLCEYMQMIMILSVTQAIIPMYTRIWEDKGRAATVAFIEQALHFYFVLGIGLLAAMSIIGGDVLAVMASSKYSDGAVIIPWVVAGMVVEGTTSFLGAGLFVQKQTRVIMVGVVICAVLNLTLNVVLVPIMGITGAAVATLLSYAALAALSLVVGRRYLPVVIPWLQGAKLVVLGVAMYAIVSRIHLGHVAAELIARIAACVLVYALLLLVFDRRSRDAARWLWIRVRPAGAPPRTTSVKTSP